MVPNAAPAAADVRRSERLALPRLRAWERPHQHDMPVQGLAEDGGHMLTLHEAALGAQRTGFAAKLEVLLTKSRCRNGPKCLILLEAGVGIEPAWTALQATVRFGPKPSIHAGFRSIRADDYF
jgi:hypothetical protein